ncbi:MAG: type transport system ATP-binding protein [Actinomycetota bacterium]|nr:type transport system ATP-binding protein [Actinomycetota bacterium]
MMQPGEPILRLEAVRRTFGTVTAVEGLDLEVAEGELFGLLGPNGAGKTTAIRMVCGELPCDSGRILLRGQVLRSDTAHRHLVGWCPQEIVIWKQLGCLEQLTLIGRLYGMNRVAASHRGLDLLTELGLDNQRATLGGNLSGGMQRRLNIALALMHDPPLVILDEPGAGLDPAGRVLVRRLIRSLARNRTVLLTTHEMDEAERLCDRIAIMDHGVLLAHDTVDGLRRTTGGEQIIELRFATPEPGNAPSGRTSAERAAEQLIAMNGFHLRHHGATLTIGCADPPSALPAVLQRLAEVGLSPDEIRLRQPSLEDVFLHLTGEKVRS